MKFKASLPRKNTAPLIAVVSCLEKLDTTCLMFLSAKAVQFCSTKPASKDLQVSCELIQDKIFTTYRIESVANNNIMFEIGLSNLLKALNSPKSANSVSIRLTKRGGQPCICVEAWETDVDVDLVHDIPVKMMRADDIGYYLPAEPPLPQVQLELPSNRSVRAVVERLKYMDKYVYLDGDMSGNLTLRLENDRLTVKTLFGSLIPRFSVGDEPVDEHGRASVKVEVKRLAQALNFVNHSYDTATCCLIEDYCLVLYVELLPRGVGTFTYYVPCPGDRRVAAS